jgi:hypothetical protein
VPSASLPLPKKKPASPVYGTGSTSRERVIRALGDVNGWAPWTDPTSSDYNWMMEELGHLADAAIGALTPEPPEEEKAYNGQYQPPLRSLTARERDILSRVLHSLVYPWMPSVIMRADPFYSAARENINRYTRIDGDQQVLYEIERVITPRTASER